MARTIDEMAKRGRKPKEKQPTGYFYEKQEQAVIDYINATTAEEKNEIYNSILRPAFEKMVESIIRRYKLYVPGEEFYDTYNDALSFILTKFTKYDPTCGKKAFSYYGTICRNYVTGKIQSQAVRWKRNPSYGLIADEYANNISYSNLPDKNKEVAHETVGKLISRINEMVENPVENDLKPNEVKLGKALVNLFKNWEYVLTTDGSNKLNKNAILLFLREETGMDTKGIRDNMKKFKKEFLIIKAFAIE